MVQTQEMVDVVAEEAGGQAAAGPRTMTGGQALVAALEGEGIETIFGLPGVQLDGAFDALYDARDRVRVLHTRHEQATAYMADGFARTTGRVGTCLVVPGPGLLNASAALSTAYACNSPVLCVTGQIQSDLIDVGRGLLHEIPNQLGMVRSVTKHAARATTPEAIPALVREAFTHLRTGRTRPVEIEIPPDTLFASADVELLPPAPPRERPSGDPDALEQAAKLLGTAERPLIWAGGGVLAAEAWDELLALAELLQAPVATTWNGRGAISDRHYLAQTVVGGKQLLAGADVVLAVGTRFVDPATSPWGVKPGQRVVQMDVDPEEIGRNHPPTVGIEADAKAGLTALAERVNAHNRRRPSREAELTDLQRGVAERARSVGPQAEYALAIRRELPDEGIFVSEMTQVGYWANLAFPVYRPRTYIGPGYQGTLGFGFPTGLGAAVGNPGTPVVSVNGDGGFGFCLNELATMAQHRIPLVALVFDDGAYGNVRRIQQEQMGGRTIASDLRNPDYLKLADAFGVAARRVETPDALALALRESFKAAEPTLIAIPIGPVPNPWTALGLR
ncbi:MAG: Acetohydroxy acid synthase [uncultured Thermomicrobiales bacterium]|uniref:Acetohydroxy acid synthase n=1 Tax=uncultured Thermomicrobiales bacterium TaxID=1645740 RepID=A0A6J4U7S7_9BACT|nr:MAG: Acetohydroxy acid synthase [uncultured Thermomicrobiales bacterium]